jgi:hypothetical protein
VATLGQVIAVFRAAGPDIDYSYSSMRMFSRGGTDRYGIRRMPSYGELMMATDSAGNPRSYLATEELFRRIKSMQERNMIIPVVGDFAGDHAIREVGRWLESHDARVTAIYTSNVEQYLFQGQAVGFAPFRPSEKWKRYYDNVLTLPLAPSSVFIRSIRPAGGRGVGLVSRLSPADRFLEAYRNGSIRAYTDLASYSH